MVKLMLETIDRFEKGDPHHPWLPFEEVIKEQLPSLKETLSKKILKREEQPERLWGNVLYGMAGRSFWKKYTKEISWVAEQKVSA
jgi:hypothetical protein